MKQLVALIVGAVLGYLLCLYLTSPVEPLQKWAHESVARDSVVSELEKSLASNIRVDYDSVRAPIGYFILVKSNKDRYAIRFSNFERKGDAKPPTKITLGIETRSAAYDWFRFTTGNGVSTIAARGSDLVEDFDVFHFGRYFSTALLRSRGNSTLKCGDMRILWYYPTGVAFQGGTTPKSEFEIAPTRWKEVTDINFDDPRLQWFKFVENKTEVTLLPIDRLW
jgi:hypothetical protein